MWQRRPREGHVPSPSPGPADLEGRVSSADEARARAWLVHCSLPAQGPTGGRGITSSPQGPRWPHLGLRAWESGCWCSRSKPHEPGLPLRLIARSPGEGVPVSEALRAPALGPVPACHPWTCPGPRPAGPPWGDEGQERCQGTLFAQTRRGMSGFAGSAPSVRSRIPRIRGPCERAVSRAPGDAHCVGLCTLAHVWIR